MYSQKSLGLPDRFEAPHPSLPYSGRFMRLLCPIVRVPIGDMDCFRNQLSVSDSIAPQLICHDLSELAAMISQQTLKEPLSGCATPFGLEKYVNHFAVLVYGSPKIMLLTINFDENFINEEGIAVTPVPKALALLAGQALLSF